MMNLPSLQNLIDQVSLIKPQKLNQLLGLKYGGMIHDVLSAVLLRPTSEFITRPSKKIRGRLVELGFLLVQPDGFPTQKSKAQCQKIAQAIEYLHAGSLAVDDVQDGSKMRRGQPTLHQKLGLPVALNIGNWLYFWPLEIISELGLTPQQELQIYKIYHRTLFKAHVGQALDVGIQINTLPRDRIYDVCLAAMELKSGALFSLALCMGAIVGGASKEQLTILERFGHGLGIGLQMFDDIGNIKGRRDPVKRWEDLTLKRPTWIWAFASCCAGKEPFKQFCQAVSHLPHDRRIERWLENNNFVSRAKKAAQDHLNQCFDDLEENLPGAQNSSDVFVRLRSIADQITRAYG